MTDRVEGGASRHKPVHSQRLWTVMLKKVGGGVEGEGDGRWRTEGAPGEPQTTEREEDVCVP